MKHCRKILFTMIIAAMALFFTGCGCETKATVKVNPDGSGTRTMVCSIPKSELTAFGKNKLSEVDTIIANNTPKVMTYTYSEDKKNYVATFVLNFDSTEDYEQKLNTFCKKKAKVTREISKSPFAVKISYSENLSTTEMLEWLVDAMIDNKVVAERNRGNFFESVNTSLEFEGKRYDSGSGRLSVLHTMYCEIESLDIYTTYVGEGKYSRVVTINIKEKELQKNEEAIKDYLTEAIPEGGYGAWDGDKYSVVLADMTPEELTAAMAKFTGYEDYEFTTIQQEEENGLFSKPCGFFEDADWSNYACNAKGTVNVNYYLDEKNAEGDVVIDRNGGYEVIEKQSEGGDSSYICFPLGLVNSYGVRAVIVHYFHSDSVKYSVVAEPDGNLKKEIEFHYDNVKPAEIKEVFDRIELLRDEEGNGVLTHLDVDYTEETLTFKMTGTAAEINEAMGIISGREDCKDLSFAGEVRWLVPFTRIVVGDRVNLEGFIHTDEENSAYWRIPIQYHASVPGLGNTVIGENVPLANKGNSFDGTLHTGDDSKFVYTALSLNKLAFAWYALMLVCVLALLWGIFFVVRSVIERKREVNAILDTTALPAGDAAEAVEALPVAEAAPVAEALPVAEEVTAALPEESAAALQEEPSESNETDQNEEPV